MVPKDNFFILTIDGGAATGKSSTARGIAHRLDCMHVDTGAHYRAFTLALINAGTHAKQPAAIDCALSQLKIGSHLNENSAQLTINGSPPIDSELRSERVNAQVSQFAALAPVRDKLFDYQRSLATYAHSQGFAGLVMEGRDIGSVIFPAAEHRFFLFADAHTRAQRRQSQGQQDAIDQRDQIDRSRAVAPLTCPAGAIQIDTSKQTLAEVIQCVIDHVQASSVSAQN